MSCKCDRHLHQKDTEIQTTDRQTERTERKNTKRKRDSDIDTEIQTHRE